VLEIVAPLALHGSKRAAYPDIRRRNKTNKHKTLSQHTLPLPLQPAAAARQTPKWHWQTPIFRNLPDSVPVVSAPAPGVSGMGHVW
jgi:hypothetical protein